MGYADDPLFGSYNLKGINQQLLTEARANAARAGINRIGITAGMNDHRLMTTSGNVSRHSKGNALDFGSFNGYPVTSPQGAALAAQYAKALEDAGYTRNHESGNARAVLYGFNDPARGGNHLNHVHVSYRPDLGGNTPVVTATPRQTRSQKTPLSPSIQISGLTPPAPLGTLADPGSEADPSILRGQPNDAITQAQTLYNQPPYDPSGDMARYEAAIRQAATRPTQQGLEAEALRAKLAAEQQYGQQMDAIQPPQQEELVAPEYPTLQLPDVPTRQAPRFDPASGIIAALGGLIAPQYAGQLGAAPLNAGIANADQQYNDAQQSYSERLRQKMLQHQDALQQRDDQIRTSQYNNQVRYKNSLESTRSKMEQALRNLNVGTDSGRLAALDKFNAEAKPADEAAVNAELLKEKISGAERADEKRLGRADKLLNLGLTQQTREDNNAATNATRALAAQLQAQTRQYGADRSLEGRVYGADKGYEGKVYGADKSLEGKKYAADASLAGKKYAADKGLEGKGQKAVNQTLAKSDPRYATLAKDRTIKNRALQHIADQINSNEKQVSLQGKHVDPALVQQTDNLKSLYAQNAKELKAITDEMDEKEKGAVTAAKKFGPPSPAKLPSGISGLRLGK